ncbi:beta-lactamase family protein [Spiractinospora alimapuensis]|uniref:serine hydrolase domain-containing protein n=1 Tax=Spiractinospora alimapuensis TaxID=2820884 RepID=UPI001F4391F4|nr:serine hydrolase domain-containing protein [Spiractinospora alimapuensis]QVQ52609.1 beta-lactamase family protein [Spiractinospora alimapuensis]
MRGAIALVALLLAVPAAPPDVDDDLLSRVDSTLEESLSDTGVPGLAYAVVTPDGAQRVGAFGHDGNDAPVTADTPFLWGSIAKPVASTAVLTLVESGQVELDAPVRRYLPEFDLAGPSDISRITVRHLLEQTSGFPEDTPLTDRFDEIGDPYERAVRDLADIAPQSEPGVAHTYSSVNYLIIGAIVEAVTGESYTSYLRRAVLEPLEMDTVIIEDSDGQGLPPGHRVTFGRPVAFDAPYDPAGASYGGYMGGTVEDLAAFATVHLNGGEVGGQRLLEAEQVAEAHEGAITLSDSMSYGLGWREDSRNQDLGTVTYWHGGAVSGYHAIVVLLPEAGYGLVVLQNAYSDLLDDQVVSVGLNAARILAGGTGEVPASAPAYWWLLVALSTVVVTGAALTVDTVRRLLGVRSAEGEGPAPARRVWAPTLAWVLGAACVAWLAVVGFPAWAGFGMRTILLFTPDIGWLLVAIAATGICVAGLRIALAVVRTRARRSRGAV